MSEGTGGFFLLHKILKISILYLDFPPITVNNLFKFSARDRDLEYILGEIKIFQYLPTNTMQCSSDIYENTHTYVFNSFII